YQSRSGGGGLPDQVARLVDGRLAVQEHGRLLDHRDPEGFGRDVHASAIPFMGDPVHISQAGAGSCAAVWNTKSPRFPSTSMVSPGLNSPESSFMASGFCSRRWMVRLSGRAPRWGS